MPPGDGAVPGCPEPLWTTWPLGRSPTLRRRMHDFLTYDREEFRKQYHNRSNVESVFHMMKAKFGGRVRSYEGPLS